MIDDIEISHRLDEGYTDEEWSEIAAIIGDGMPADEEQVRIWLHAMCFSVMVHAEIDKQRDRSAEEQNYRDVASASASLLTSMKAQPDFWETALEVVFGEQRASARFVSELTHLVDFAKRNAAVPTRKGRPPKIARSFVWRQLVGFWRDELGLPVTRSVDPITGDVTGRLERFLVAAIAPACLGNPPTLQAASDFIRHYRSNNGDICA